MRDLKTFLFVAPVVSNQSMVWGFRGSINRNQSFILGCIDIPLFFIIVIGTGRDDKD